MTRFSEEILRDALARLNGWTGDSHELHRRLPLNDGQHRDLTERVKVYADAMRLRPDIKRVDGSTHIRVRAIDGGPVTTTEVALAARIEDAYRVVTDA